MIEDAELGEPNDERDEGKGTDNNGEISYTSMPFIKKEIIAYVKKPEKTRTKKDAREHAKLTEEQYEAMETALEAMDPVLYMKYLEYLKPKEKTVEKEEEPEVICDKDVREIKITKGNTEITVPETEVLDRLEKGIITLREGDREIPKSDSFRSVKDRAEAEELNIGNMLLDLQSEDEATVFKRNGLKSSADIAEFYELARQAEPERYHIVMQRKYRASFTVDDKNKTAIFTQERELAEPATIEMEMVSFLKALINQGLITRKSIDLLDFVRDEKQKKKSEQLTMLEMLLSGKVYSKEELKKLQPIIEQLEKEAKALEKKDPEKADVKMKVVESSKTLGDSSAEYEAAQRLYNYVKEGGPMKKDMTLSEACKEAVSYSGKNDGVSEILTNDEFTQRRIFSKVQKLDEIEGPNGQKMEESVRISKHLKVKLKEHDAKVKESWSEAFGEVFVR